MLEWEFQEDIEVTSYKTISMRLVNTYAPSRKSCPHCKFDGVRHKGGKKWEKFYYVKNNGTEIQSTEKTKDSFWEELDFICRKCEKLLKKGR